MNLLHGTNRSVGSMMEQETNQYDMFLPVLWVGGERVGLDKSEHGNSIAENVGAPQQRDPVVEDDSRREPVEVISIGYP